MAKLKSKFVCSNCSAEFSKWFGKCSQCNSWDSLVETFESKSPTHRLHVGSSNIPVFVKSTEESNTFECPRLASELSEVDRVLGSGLVQGSLVLLGGEPGIGKSTLLLQYAKKLITSSSIAYVSAEESLEQVLSRAKRLSCTDDRLHLLHSADLDSIIANLEILQPSMVVIDSIQTMYTSSSASSAGSVSQVRECTNRLIDFAKSSSFKPSILLIGHVTKDGSIAGPKTLEHMVDTVLYFESDPSSDFRLLRSVKNRYGMAHELGVFEMTGSGLEEVLNPSEIFQPSKWDFSSGSTASVSLDGTRPIVIEVQSLAIKTAYGNPRRNVVGYDYNRLAMLLAVLEKYSTLRVSEHDVFLNFAGGFKTSETALDLAVISAIASSLRNKPVPNRSVFLGEVSLSGKVRPVSNFESRVSEAQKLGAETIIANTTNLKSSSVNVPKLVHVSNLSEVLQYLS